MDKCVENYTQGFIKDMRHYDEGLCEVSPLFGLPLQMPGSFFNKQTKYLKFRLQFLTGVQLID